MNIHDRRRLIVVAGLIAACAMMPCRSHGGEAPHTRPNIILFLGDDHSVWDAGCYGNEVVRTANLDRLASQGMRFDRAFTATAMCAPARSMLYTGIFPHRNGCHMNHGTTRQKIKSLPHYLRPLGYRVVLAGKRHIKPKKVYPFEYLDQKDIDKVILGNEPFCLIIASHEPHGPHEQGGYNPKEVPIPPYLPDTPAVRSQIADYYTDIDTLDRELGHALNLLTQSGKQDNTLFIYAADHGYGLMAKWTCYETGLRVPFVARWPGRVKAGSVTGAMVSFVDVLPTFLDAAGAKEPDGIDGKSFLGVLTGKTEEHRKLIFGAHTNQGIISGEPYPVRSVRDARYKYIRNLNPDGRPTNAEVFGRNHKEMATGAWAEWKAKARTDADASRLLARVMNRPAEELYDLAQDPWELTNLESDPSLAEVKERLRRELDRWMKQQGDLGMAAELAVKPHKSMQTAKYPERVQRMEERLAEIEKGKSKYVPMFNGKDLTGWTALPGGNWEVRDGVIVGTSPASEKRHGMLLSDKQYSDFEVSLEYKALSGNSGFYFRAERVKHAVSVAGFQAEIDARGSNAGGLYETLGRTWVVKPPAATKAFKRGEWNKMTVRAVRSHIVVHLNGTKTAELKDDPGRLKGHFGLQLHGGQKMDVAFRNIRIKELK